MTVSTSHIQVANLTLVTDLGKCQFRVLLILLFLCSWYTCMCAYNIFNFVTYTWIYFSDMIRRRNLRTRAIKMLVLDEADEMLNKGKIMWIKIVLGVVLWTLHILTTFARSCKPIYYASWITTHSTPTEDVNMFFFLNSNTKKSHTYCYMLQVSRSRSMMFIATCRPPLRLCSSLLHCLMKS